MALVSFGSIDELDDVIRTRTGDWPKQLELGKALQFFGKLSEQAAERIAHLLDVAELVGVAACATRELNLLLTTHDLGEVVREGAAGAPDIDLEGEGVLLRLALEHPLQRRVGDESAIPVELAIDFDRREARW